MNLTLDLRGEIYSFTVVRVRRELKRFVALVRKTATLANM